MHVVVRFLALLELYRDGKVELQQAATFGEIEVAWKRMKAALSGPGAAIDTRALEALLFVSDEPLTPAVLSQALESTGARSTPCATGCRASSRSAARASCLRNVAGGWRLFTDPDTQPIVERFVLVLAPGADDEGGPRDARDRRVQATRHPAPGERDPRRELRRRPARARRPRADRGGRSRRRPGASAPVRDHAPAFLERLGLAVAGRAAVARAAAGRLLPVDRRRRPRGRSDDEPSDEPEDRKMPPIRRQTPTNRAGPQES